MVVNALSVDVEEWYHAELITDLVSMADRTPRLRKTLPRILELLRQEKTRSTFFIVGEVVRGNEDLICEIVADGHELGCHGYSHKPLYRLTPREFERELALAEESVASVVGPNPISGFRAPTFSMSQQTSWALDVLEKRGYRYDSSIFPFRNHVYGVNGAPSIPYRPDHSDIRKDSNEGIWEFPLTVVGKAPFGIPISGGFYLRCFPVALISILIRLVNRKGRPVIVYFHPWETDESLPRYPVSRLDRFITYSNLETMFGKIQYLLARFKFAPVCDVLKLATRSSQKTGSGY